MKTLTRSIIISFGLVALAAWSAWTGDLTIPYPDFVGGTPAVADQVDANFAAVETEVDDNNARITINARMITRRNGVQQYDWPSLDITSTSDVVIKTITINDTGTFDVSLTAHVVLEISGDGTGRSEIRINNSTDGTYVGRGWWRPGSATGYQAITVCFSGFESSVTGPVTYNLIVRKFDPGAGDASVGPNGLNVEWTSQ